MRIMAWNVRGLNTPNKWYLIKRQIDEAKGDIWVLQETKWNISEIDMRMQVWRQWTGLWKLMVPRELGLMTGLKYGHKTLEGCIWGYMGWDCRLKLAFPSLSIPPLFGNSSSKPPLRSRPLVQCDTRDPGWVKINFNGASLGNPSPSGIGCVIRDEFSNSLMEVSKHIGHSTNNLAEFRVALHGIQVGVCSGAWKTHLEGDSLNVVNAIRKNETPCWILNQWLRPIKSLLNDLEDFHISHIYREGNVIADGLAKEAM
ncbi:uncharacterized protein LOC131857740 [Cryptomeria japonica]|uniref:uncharacterized protein LOC131857740 n=1 Tax=Cryptomeria japonica TaxID=3369 RepID=UPI0027DA2DB5|nr:uncharacterized protein LOC131857740 [Cryptomeria japonica]